MCASRRTGGCDVHDVTAAILVGGRALRLGGQFKPTLRIGAQTIVERQLDAVRMAGVHDILFVGRWPETPMDGGRHVPDLVERSGPLGGMYSALLVAVTPLVLVLAGDLPFVNEKLLRHLTRLDAADDAVVPRTREGWHPLCATYRRRVALRLKARLDRGELRVTGALSELRVREVSGDALAGIDSSGLLLMNVNSPDDLMRAERAVTERS